MIDIVHACELSYKHYDHLIVYGNISVGNQCISESDLMTEIHNFY